MKQEEKVLTREVVKELGLNKLEIITSDMLEGYTSIRSYAFWYCNSIISITIPNSVTSIGFGVFSGCSDLISITVENGNTRYDSRNNCNAIIETATNTLIAGCKNTTIPNSVTSIGESAFEGCTGLTSITIPDSVTSIEDLAFEGCTGLTSIVVESGNTKYDSHNKCNAIIETATNALIAGCQNTIIPDSVTSIGSYAFNDCTGLTSITIPNSVTSIESYVFKGCTALTSITIGNSVTSIGKGAFYNCTGLTSVTFPNSVTSIEGGAFCGCTSFTSITIPNSVTSIREQAFEYCSSLTSITIPNSIKCIDKYAFFYCNKLKNVVIGDKVYKKHKVIKNKCKAYKAFNADLTCLGFQYKEGNTYEIDGEPQMCKQGFHACLNLLDVFNHYSGEIGKDIVVYEVELEGVSDERNNDDSKIIAKKITIGKRIL